MRKTFITTGVILLFFIVTILQSHAEDLIYGCVKMPYGTLRIVSSPTKCSSTEIAIYWNQVGPQGPQGEPGPQGDDGIDGLNCWDLNADGYCNLPDEDKNNDTICDASDCQGEPGIGAFQVYDDDGQYLGILSNMAYGNPTGTFTIYITSL